ncbi:MAG: ATP synthase F1 subunit delta [Eubacteriales bacterium]|nr:ATP synthase F1 subunit delta [Eubacteriales bacterium]
MAKLVSSTYGDALFELALEQDRVDQYLEEAQFVRDAFLANEDMQGLFDHPKIRKEEKNAFIGSVFGDKVSEEMVGFLHIIVTKDRYDEILPIFEYFIHRVKEHKGIGTAHVTSAIEMTKEQKEAVEKKLLATTRYNTFEMDYKVDPSILGGLIIRIQDRVVDSSLKTQLDKLSKELSKIQL